MNIQVGCAYPLDLLYANVRKNCATHSRWTVQSEAHDGHAVLIGGGPSLVDKLDLIKWRAGLGQTLFALNGACRFLNKNGIVPEYQVFLDANEDMGERVGEAKQYLVSSQCSITLLAALPADRVTLWHFGLPEVQNHIPDHDGPFNIIGGGLTIGLTAMCLAYAMGFRKLHVFGYDCSNRNGKDHAYDVPITEERLGDAILNDVEVSYGDKIFRSTLAMTAQAETFPKVCNNLIDAGALITVDVDKDCLLAAVLQDVFSNPAQAPN